jgi:predicted porin
LNERTLIALAAAAVLSSGIVHAQEGSSGPGDAGAGQGQTRPGARTAEGSYTRLGGSLDIVGRRDSGGPGGPTYSVGPGGARSSRMTFSIKEVISPELAATVVLEAGLAPDTGLGASNPPGVTGGFSFGRTSHVGIGSDDWGYVTLGRQYTPMQAVTAGPINDPFGGAWLGGIATVYNKNSLASNTIAYSYGYGAEALLRPAPRNGLGVAVEYSFGEVPSPLEDAGKQYGLNVSYGGSAWWAGYAYHRQVGNGPFINPAVANTESPQITHQFIGGAYEFGRLRLSLGLNTGRNDTGTLNRRNWSFGVNWGVGERGTVKFLFGRANDRTAPNADFDTLQAAYSYDLSKRTALYVVYGTVDNSAPAAVTLSGAIGTVAPGGRANSLAVGVRHSF